MPAMQPGSGGPYSKLRYLRFRINRLRGEIKGGRYKGFPRKKKWAEEDLANLIAKCKELNVQIRAEEKSLVPTVPKTA